VELYVSPGPDGRAVYVVTDWVRRPALAYLVALFALVALAVAGFKGLRAVAATGASLAIVVGFVVPQIVAGVTRCWCRCSASAASCCSPSTSCTASTGAPPPRWSAPTPPSIVTMLLAIDLHGPRPPHRPRQRRRDLPAGRGPAGGAPRAAAGRPPDRRPGRAHRHHHRAGQRGRELAHTDPSLSLRELYGRAMNVGRDHVGSLVNTLVLAYTGASLSLLLLLNVGEFGFQRARSTSSSSPARSSTRWSARSAWCSPCRSPRCSPRCSSRATASPSPRAN
jgi:hypothetical protein